MTDILLSQRACNAGPKFSNCTFFRGLLAAFLTLGAPAIAQDASAPRPVPTEKRAPETKEKSVVLPDHEIAVADKRSFPSLNDIVVSGEAGVPLEYPGGRDQVDKETLDTYPDKTAESVLRRTPGIYLIPENGNDARVHIGLRGNDPRRSGLTAILIDGIPIAEAPYGNTDIDGLPIALERVDKIDVIRGGASVRYGPNSAGGVVNFLTPEIPLDPTLLLGVRMGSNAERAYWSSVGGTWERLGVQVTGVYKEGDGYRERGDYSDRDGAAKFRFALSDHETIQAYFSRFSEPHANQSGGLTQADYDADPSQSTRQDNFFRFDSNRYVVQYENNLDDETRFQLLTWYQEGRRVLADVRPVVAPYTIARAQNSDFSSKAIEARFGWSDWIGGKKHTFYHSGRYLQETNDELYTRADLVTGAPLDPDLDANFEGRAFALFSEDSIALTDRLDWAIGFRLESLGMSGVSNADQNQIVKNYDIFLPETNLSYRIGSETALYGSYQQTFYPPQYETGFDPASVLYAPIDPESADAFEVGIRSHPVDGLETTLSVFYTRFADKIDFLNTPDGKVPINSGDARSLGVEAAAFYDFGARNSALSGLSAYATVTEQTSKITSGDNDGNDTPDAPRHLASWGLMYQHHESGLWARLGGSYSSDSFRDAANTPIGTPDGLNGPVPGFTLWDAAAGWRQRADGNGLSFAVGVTNAFDEEYFRRFATGIYPGAPQQFSATLTYAVRL